MPVRMDQSACFYDKSYGLDHCTPSGCAQDKGLFPFSKARQNVTVDLMKWIDIPPFWLLACMALTYLTGQVGGADTGLDLAVLRITGGALIAAGVVLMVLAVLEMRRFRTTVLPHMTADTLVRTGIFARSRNPIYLGDMLVLAGYILWTGVLWAAPLLAGLFWVLKHRFILPEEQRLAARFGPEFDDYCRQTRRWA